MTRQRLPLPAVGLCTFRRPQVTDTLRSLAAQAAGGRVTVIVADNDDGPTAAEALSALEAEGLPLDLVYLHAPARNISVARNAVLDEADRRGLRYLAFIDDDETATPSWLETLAQRMARDGADAVLGPVRASYLPGAPEWMQRLHLHDTVPEFDSRGAPSMGYSCNVLIDLHAPAFRERRFDTDRGRSGGEDTVYFAQALARGARIAWEPDAEVRETVPAHRATWGWLLRRRFRMGQTHAALIAENASALRRGRLAVIAGGKAAACAVLALPRLHSPPRRNASLLRGTLHLGVVAALLGRADLAIYGNGTPADAPARQAEKPVKVE